MAPIDSSPTTQRRPAQSGPTRTQHNHANNPRRMVEAPAPNALMEDLAHGVAVMSSSTSSCPVT
jgi:hypothetical protein